VLILLAWMLLEWQEARRTTRHRSRLWLRLVLPVLPVAGLLALLGVEILSQEFAGLEGRIGGHVAARFSAALGAWRMFLDRPLFGMGAGTFQAAFPYYQDVSLRGFYRHAHNDWIQWLSELGIVGCGLALATALAMWPHARRPLRTGAVDPSLVRGMGLALAGVALHACIDFPFRIPGVAVVAAAWLGVVTRHDVGRRSETGRNA